jgi:hypothetical protein
MIDFAKEIAMHRSPRRMFGLLLVLVAMTIFAGGARAQSLQRECAASAGSAASVEGIFISQTIGQCYVTSGYSGQDFSLLPGFQQPTVFARMPVASNAFFHVSLHPNPAAYSFVLESDIGLEDADFRVVDMSGRMIVHEKISDLKNLTVDCREWPEGVYALSVLDRYGRSRTLKLIVSK